tara:strand:+ start:62 stop:172 length:111 start_codon:yes stop_codon:yes gene_type:complete
MFGNDLLYVSAIRGAEKHGRFNPKAARGNRVSIALY